MGLYRLFSINTIIVLCQNIQDGFGFKDLFIFTGN